MELSKEDALMLIQSYENHTLLWNPKHKWHFHKMKKMYAWQEIADSCNLTVEEAKKKMNSLLGSFRREKNKGFRIIGIGAGATKVYKSDWFAFKHFQFLLNKENLPRIINKEERSQENEEIEMQSEDSEITDTMIMHSPESNDDCSCLQCTVKSKEPSFATSKKLLQQPVESEDTTTKYTKYLTDKLNQFDSRTRSILIHNINNLIFDAEMKMYSIDEISNNQLSSNGPTCTIKVCSPSLHQSSASTEAADDMENCYL